MNKISKKEELDVDVRFLLANERTLLAWVRTGLTIEAGGIALTAFHQNTPLPGILVLFLGILVAVVGYGRYRITDKSIRAGHLPPSDGTAALQVYGITVLAVFIALLQVTILR
ncbi:MAG: DUF202 domain-containing protein [Candidatus Nomurabacteria bacterium]|nr:MAG: DUF202 domain-containing protein [Candidatus Nomurabacteria bacterium]